MIAWFLKSENSMRAGVLYDAISCCHVVETLGQEIADDQLLADFGGVNGAAVEAAIEAHTSLESDGVSPLEATTAAANAL
jgi:hypothetical protein